MTPERTLAPDVGSMNSPAYLKAFAEHAVTVTLAYRLRRVERSPDARLLATLYSEHARHEAAAEAAAAKKMVKADSEWSGDDFVRQSDALARV